MLGFTREDFQPGPRIQQENLNSDKSKVNFLRFKVASSCAFKCDFWKERKYPTVTEQNVTSQKQTEFYKEIVLKRTMRFYIAVVWKLVYGIKCGCRVWGKEQDRRTSKSTRFILFDRASKVCTLYYQKGVSLGDDVR